LAGFLESLVKDFWALRKELRKERRIAHAELEGVIGRQDK